MTTNMIPKTKNKDGAPPPAEGSDAKHASQQLLAAIRDPQGRNKQ
jgi:hypothetical protein